MFSSIKVFWSWSIVSLKYCCHTLVLLQTTSIIPYKIRRYKIDINPAFLIHFLPSFVSLRTLSQKPSLRLLDVVSISNCQSFDLLSISDACKTRACAFGRIIRYLELNYLQPRFRHIRGSQIQGS